MLLTSKSLPRPENYHVKTWCFHVITWYWQQYASVLKRCLSAYAFFAFVFFFFKLAQVERNFDSEGKIFSLILFPLWGKNAKTARLIHPIILNLPHTDRRSAEILSASLCSYISMPNVSPCPRPATRVNKPACGAGTFHLLWWRENREQKGAMSNTRRFQFLWNVPPSVCFFFFFF